MIDYARITVKAGDGGRGAGSFFRGKGGRFGKASGGDGGRGGDVYIEVTRDLNTLEPYRYVKDYKAQNGENGGSNFRKGAEGEDLVLKVPVGTEIKVAHLSGPAQDSLSKGKGKEAGLENGQELRVKTNSHFDLVRDSEGVLVAQGGRGGRGNAKLRDEYGRRPRAGEPGQIGETYQVVLELKLIADVGLIGLPNSGKSTLLSALTAARPKIAPYPFTTLEPNLGVLDSLLFIVHGSSGKTEKDNKPYERSTINDARLVIADIPGLIEGASKGKGLGDLFLRHIERTKVLVHLIDASVGLMGKGKEAGVVRGLSLGAIPNLNLLTNNLWHDYQTVRSELKAYSKELVKKPEIIVLTKIDLIGQDNLKIIKSEFGRHRKKALAVSSVTKEGLKDLIYCLFKLLDRN